jgi:hypothetical protein
MIALRGIPSNCAVSGSCTIVRPPIAVISFIPWVPLLPVPDRTIAIARSSRCSASDTKNTST